jgi:hypothetical protein
VAVVVGVSLKMTRFRGKKAINHRRAYKYLGVSEKYNMDHKYEKERLKKKYVKRLRSFIEHRYNCKNKT